MLDTVVNRYIDELSLKDKEKYCKLMRIFEAEVEENTGIGLCNHSYIIQYEVIYHSY